MVISCINDHKTIEELFVKMKELTPLGKDLKSSSENQEALNKISVEIDEKILALTQNYKKSGLDTMFIEIAGVSLDSTSVEFMFLSELSINCFINKLLYKEEVKSFINQNKVMIITEFCPERFQGINPESIRIKVEVHEGETHNQGRSPAFIKFKSGENQLFKVVYKPRNAAIDKAVIDTFGQINQLPQEQKTSSNPLPVYKILNFENKSLWEFIEGKDIKESRSAGAFIQSNLKGKRRDRAQHNLDRMDAILSMMSISDLHNENIRVRNFEKKDKDVEFVPIDMENRQN